ncbi:glycosyltransferase family 4 protein [uncultured Christiangramia sp.]|uniref:glycosyltransferase family 4 protein n=1 Tax=uncultured Christiangramia sp. TaxID=503836 RepID=UPI00263650F9|nr:glycosyltransferase family 4 protein [uncultured Christiangramia sp.]
MQILQLVTKRQYRGAEVFAANLSSELIKLGHSIIFAGLYQNTDNVLVVEGAENIDLSSKKQSPLSLSLIHSLSALIRKTKPDIIQCNGSDTLKYTILATRGYNQVPVIYRNISTISEWMNNYFSRKFYDWLFKRVDYVTSVGEKSLEDLVSTFNYPKQQTAVIRRGIPMNSLNKQDSRMQLLRELNLHQDDKIVIHVGNFSPEKNHQFLLDIFYEISQKDSHVKLVCVGNGQTFNDIKSQIIERNLENTIFLLGFRKDIPRLLAGSECFLLCSLIEGVPGVIMEAAVQGVPAISSNVGGVSEVVENEKTGILIEGFYTQNYVRNILKVVYEDAFRNKLALNAYDQVLEKFDPERNAKVVEELYNNLLKKKEVI